MKIFLFITLLLQVAQFSSGDVEARIDELEAQVQELKDEIGALDVLEKVVKGNIADQKLDKTIACVLLNEQEKAAMHWKEVLQFLDPALQPKYLKSLIESTYLGNSVNFYYILDFLTSHKLYNGYPILYKELEMNGEIRRGFEIFALAYMTKSVCGTSNKLYAAMPKVVREILEGPVILKNKDNNGYILAGDGPYDCTSDKDCYDSTKNQAFIFHLQSSEINELQNNTKAHWEFTGPVPPNVTELANGFYIKNQGLFFVFHQRPPAAYFRSNLTFAPYHSRDLHAQFEPALLPNASSDESLVRIGIRERFFRKLSYFFSGDFVKRNNKLDFSRLPIFQDEVKGFEWEVTPVGGDFHDNIDNAIEGTDTDENCKFSM